MFSSESKKKKKNYVDDVWDNNKNGFLNCFSFKNIYKKYFLLFKIYF
jgi:hypothetical protein